MSDEDDGDWFEDALRDEDRDADQGGDGTTDDRTADENGTEPSGTRQSASPAEDGSAGGADDGEGGDAPAGTGGGFAMDDDESAFGDTGTDGSGAFSDTGADDPFSGATAFEGDDAGGEMFDEGFEEAMGGGETDFENDDFESDIPRIDLGIEGLDNMIQGGVPQRHLIVTVGGAGTGKTTFGLQYLHHGLRKEDTDRGVFITLEQTYEDIMATANERGWEFDRHEAEGNLAIIDLDPVEMANSLDNIRGELPELIEDFDADRFVLDSVSLLEMMYDDVSRRRTEVFDFTQSLKDAGVTTVLTSEANEDNAYASRHGIIEYLTDAVFFLRYVRSETQETRLAVEIQKIRNANHSRETKPYEITMDGISVFDQANIF